MPRLWRTQPHRGDARSIRSRGQLFRFFGVFYAAQIYSDTTTHGVRHMYLQSDLLRVIWATHPMGGAPKLQVMHGTAFLLGKDGVFLTARHVLHAATQPNPNGMRAAIYAVAPDDRKVVEEITHIEYAPNGQDVAIGRSNFKLDSLYRLHSERCTVWTPVLSAGYPEDAFVRDGEGLKTPLRAFSGIIQRMICPGDLQLAVKASGFELSFSPSPGMSGAPLCLKWPTKNDHLAVIGVCVGAFRSEQVEDEYTEVKNDGSRYIERRVRITQFGLAESIFPLLDWTPKALNGLTLREALCHPGTV